MMAVLLSFGIYIEGLRCSSPSSPSFNSLSNSLFCFGKSRTGNQRNCRLKNGRRDILHKEAPVYRLSRPATGLHTRLPFSSTSVQEGRFTMAGRIVQISSLCTWRNGRITPSDLQLSAKVAALPTYCLYNSKSSRNKIHSWAELFFGIASKEDKPLHCCCEIDFGVGGKKPCRNRNWKPAMREISE